MANEEHVKILKQGPEAWNRWRERFHNIKPDLRTADLRGLDLWGVDLTEADLWSANLHRTNLSEACLRGAVLSGCVLVFADLRRSTLLQANLSEAFLNGADLSIANLRQANLSYARVFDTIFGNVDLSSVVGLETVIHQGPSSIGIDTIYRSKGQIPEVFLRGCGIPEDFITYARSLIGKAINFYSCFVSYSHKDEEFAQRLYSKLRDAHIRVWYAPEDMKGGQKLQKQIYDAIQMHDRLLLVLSENSMQSEWVVTEIRRARKAEAKTRRRKLFPIRLVDFQTIREWECFDADTGKDLASEVREYFIPDFANWKDDDSFELAANRLLNDLKAAET